MLELEAKLFVSAVTQLRSIILVTERIPDRSVAIPLDDRAMVLNHLNLLITEVTKAGARSAQVAAARLHTRLSNSENALTYDDVLRTMSDIESRFVDHFDDIKLFVLHQNETTFMQPVDALLSVPEHVVEDFSLAYPNASFEIEEAAKCIALGRSTAAAFHSMRAVECGIKAICALLEIPDATKPAEKNWGNILKAIKSAIDEKWPAKSRVGNSPGVALERLYATLDAIKNPWRNATMHVETVYAIHESLHILRCSAVFLRELSRRCDEQGREPNESPAATVPGRPTQTAGNDPNE
ncbi:MAG: hypothetical protein JJ969_07165 [Rhizobiaceae bacterium]|nr:hypothetical protein [Rhizobiaceae bacterium]